MKIMITGGAGYIGSHIALSAIVAGHSVLIYDNLSNSGKATVSFLGSRGATMSLALKGRPSPLRGRKGRTIKDLTPEQRRKMSESAKARRINNSPR